MGCSIVVLDSGLVSCRVLCAKSALAILCVTPVEGREDEAIGAVVAGEEVGLVFVFRAREAA